MLTREDIISNPKLQARVREEMMLTEPQERSTEQVIKECISELEQQGFLNLSEIDERRHYEVMD